MSPKHFLSLRDVSVQDIQALVQRAIQLKTQSQQGRRSGLLPPLTGKTLSLIFSKRSTRTRVSAETGWAHYGGQSLFLGKNDIQMGSGEPIQDTARVVSSMTDAIFARLGPHEDIEVEFTHLQ
jgi:ornithine carbamoyltransferase